MPPMAIGSTCVQELYHTLTSNRQLQWTTVVCADMIPARDMYTCMHSHDRQVLTQFSLCCKSHPGLVMETQDRLDLEHYIDLLVSEEKHRQSGSVKGLERSLLSSLHQDV